MTGPSKSPPGKTGLLLIEDNPGDARLLCEMLSEQRSLDIEVTQVGRLSDGQAHLATASVDVILVDLGLPDAQGLEALRRTRAAAPHVPIVVLTGLNDEALALEALKEGAQDYLVKGQIGPDGLLRALRYAIERNGLEAAAAREQERAYQAQKMQSIGQLAGGIAHDFNNILTVITASAEMLEDELGPDVPEIELVSEIRHAADRAALLTRQLLAYSRRDVAELREVDLHDAILDIESMLRRLIGEDIALVIRLKAGASRVRMDAGQLLQLVMNLAANARDAMPAGGTLTIETKDVVLSDASNGAGKALPAGAYLSLTVSDTGMGMAPDVVSHLFEPFFTTKEVGRGTGMGLAVAHGIVEQSGGQVAVESELGGGTTFTILLPLLLTAAGASASSTPEPTRGTESVLLVEDDESVRRATATGLASRGYNVITANDAKSALVILNERGGEIDLLLTDVVMPAIDGPSLVAVAIASYPSLKVLYTSGFTDDAVLRHGIREREVEFIRKPYTVTSLSARVRSVLDAA